MKIKLVTFGVSVLMLVSALAAIPGIEVFPTNPPAGVSLGWDPSPDPTVTGYFIYVGTATRSYTNKVAVGNGTTATITNLIRGTVYYFTATATDGGLESEYCNEVIYKVPSLPPPPANIRASNVVLKVSIEMSPRAKGPWTEFAQIATLTELPGFYRSAISVNHPTREEILSSVRRENVMRPPLPPAK